MERHLIADEVPVNDRPLYLVDTSTAQRFEVVAFRARVHVTVSSRTVPMRTGRIDGVPTAWGDFAFDEREIMIVNEVPGIDPRITVTPHP